MPNIPNLSPNLNKRLLNVLYVSQVQRENTAASLQCYYVSHTHTHCQAACTCPLCEILISKCVNIPLIIVQRRFHRSKNFTFNRSQITSAQLTSCGNTMSLECHRRIIQLVLHCFQLIAKTIIKHHDGDRMCSVGFQ